ncbi:ABC transporter ATP-binding protein [Sphingobacterium psychroaquaticum]|uniref:ABC transporter ATP-binding protein n=1 Tax=Sphingobacterium psychroaquaticum TaxID=561061 RepID=UPI00106AE7E5|nr:ABC transporter ATP-binding protein [Sphingobacterium psychroaquaticum]QBQ40094.1 ABC transporter ATP-binding protein [Sphingobacterium psychroaquaticum]
MLKIKNLSFHYKKGYPILNDISINLAPGHVYGLLGLNGCGKTTLLKLISSSLFPKKGVISKNMYIASERKLGYLSDLYLVTDEVDLPDWKISDILDIYSPLYPKFDRAYFENIMNKFLVDSKNHIKNLSYGQRKKVNIAFALASNVSLLLMDEPTNGLDIPAKTQFRKLISKHISDERIIIISTHQTRDIQHLIDHLLVLKEDKIAIDSSLYELNKKFAIRSGKTTDTLYSENTFNGTLSLVYNTTHEDSSFDIEFFFNALHENPTILHSLNTTKFEHHAP